MLSSMDKQQQLDGFTSSPTSFPETAAGGGGGVIARAAGPPSHPTYIGKHRMAASISNLQNQIDIIQKELTQLETVGESSIVCKELIASVESISDPLLPWTKGPADVGWDRWFRGAHNSRSHNRWI